MSLNAKRKRSYRLYFLKGDINGTVPCAICGTDLHFEQITIDRIIPGSEGGRYILPNIQPACKSCNEKRGLEWERANRDKLNEEERQANAHKLASFGG